MTVPVVRQTAPWPTRRNAQADFDQMADAVAATLPLTIDDLNEAVPFVNQLALDAGASAQAAAESAEAAALNAETVEGAVQQVTEAGQEQVLLAANQADRAETLANQAQSYRDDAAVIAAAAGAAAGLPSLENNAGKALVVKPDASGVEWRQISGGGGGDFGYKVGDIILSSRFDVRSTSAVAVANATSSLRTHPGSLAISPNGTVLACRFAIGGFVTRRQNFRASGVFTEIQVDPAITSFVDEVVYAHSSFYAREGSGFWRSQDDGLTWARLANLPVAPIILTKRLMASSGYLFYAAGPELYTIDEGGVPSLAFTAPGAIVAMSRQANYLCVATASNVYYGNFGAGNQQWNLHDIGSPGFEITGLVDGYSGCIVVATGKHNKLAYCDRNNASSSAILPWVPVEAETEDSSLAALKNPIFTGNAFVIKSNAHALVSDDGKSWVKTGSPGSWPLSDNALATDESSILTIYSNTAIAEYLSGPYLRTALGFELADGARYSGAGRGAAMEVFCAIYDPWNTINTSNSNVAGQAAHFRDMAHGNDVLVAGLSTGVLLSSGDGGATWVQRADMARPISSIAYGDGVFVAVATSGNYSTSPDGVTWTTRTGLLSGANVSAIIFDEVQFIASGASGRIATSPDGVTWTLRSSGFSTSADIRCLASGNGVILAISAAHGAAISIDGGVSWQTKSGSTYNGVQSCVHTEHGFLLVGNSGQILHTTDFATFAVRAGGTSANLYVVRKFAGDLLVIGGASGTRLQSSDGGLTWFAMIGSAPNTNLVAVGYSPDAKRLVFGGNDAVVTRGAYPLNGLTNFFAVPKLKSPMDGVNYFVKVT
tara:strand:- start:848 stop:3331 length:2484 start_codon:yes stop_codon:yes gene_type:complete